MTSIISEYQNQHPGKHITMKDLESFKLNQAQIKNAALYAMAGLTHDFGKGEIETVDEQKNITYFHKRMLTMSSETPSDEDFRKMKQHPMQGAKMLSTVFDRYGYTETIFAKTLISVAARHHEPIIPNDDNIISDVTVIITAIDQYDTMTSRRNYQTVPKLP